MIAQLFAFLTLFQLLDSSSLAASFSHSNAKREEATQAIKTKELNGLQCCCCFIIYYIKKRNLCKLEDQV